MALCMRQGVAGRVGGSSSRRHAGHCSSRVSPALQRPGQAPVQSVGPLRAVISGAGEVADMPKRTTMNLLLLGSSLGTVGALGVPYAVFFYPVGNAGAGGGQAAKDALGNDVRVAEWLKTRKTGDRSLTQGLKGDPTYLIVTNDGVEKFGLNAVCTHLGCVVPWNTAENKFKCPCHGSQYNNEGKVVRGPAPLSLALAHADVNEDGVVLFSTWKETDFRTGEKPWWS